MYHLFIGYIGASDPGNTINVDVSRFLEYTDDETQMRFRNLTGETAILIKDYPCLFMHEEVEGGAFVGRITGIANARRAYKVTFERDQSIGVIPAEDIQRLALELDIGGFEFNRTHWAIKQSDLLGILTRNKISQVSLSTKTLELSANLPPPEGATFNREQIFIVHGHDEHAKNDAKKYVESRGLEPIILHLQASGGRTIIEKIDHYSNVGFGIILYSECDTGAKRNTLSFRWRARQNVIFEHGYLLAKLSRSRVAALVKGDVETPNDISGVVYIAMDAAGAWRDELDEELKAAGYQIPIG
jgi:predicted nucleotide-binding protein